MDKRMDVPVECIWIIQSVMDRCVVLDDCVDGRIVGPHPVWMDVCNLILTAFLNNQNENCFNYFFFIFYFLLTI